MQRILVDLVGNYNINQDSSSSTSRSQNIAFVLPSFTMAAYHNSFYIFYIKYEAIVKNYEQTVKKENITSDLNLLSSTLPNKDESFFHHKSVGLQYLAQHISQFAPKTNINFLTDVQEKNEI